MYRLGQDPPETEREKRERERERDEKEGERERERGRLKERERRERESPVQHARTGPSRERGNPPETLDSLGLLRRWQASRLPQSLDGSFCLEIDGRRLSRQSGCVDDSSVRALSRVSLFALHNEGEGEREREKQRDRVCVCEGEREGNRQREREREIYAPRLQIGDP